MFGISSVELLVVLLIGVVVLGPERLPQVVRTVTKWMSQIRRFSTELQRTINAEAHLLEHNELKKQAEKELFGGKPKKKKKKTPVEPSEESPKADTVTPVPESPEITEELGRIDNDSAPAPQETAPSGTETAEKPATESDTPDAPAEENRHER